MNQIKIQLACFEYIRDNLGWDDYMCAALVGCMIVESDLNPRAVNMEEKNKSQSQYGAGIIQWKSFDRKQKALMVGLGYNESDAQKFIKHNGIESLSLNKQLQIIVNEIQFGIFKDNFNIVIRKCNDLKEAVSAVYCRFLNGFSTKTNIPTNSDIKRLEKSRNASNEKYISEFTERLRCASIVLDNYHHSIDI